MDLDNFSKLLVSIGLLSKSRFFLPVSPILLYYVFPIFQSFQAKAGTWTKGNDNLCYLYLASKNFNWVQL